MAGLALCSILYGEPLYLETAKKAAAYYYENYVAKGLTNGGPGEILSAPDSESSYAMLESFVVIYELSQDPLYLDYAIQMAKQFATWVMPYDYRFPAESEFGRLGMKTAGAVWANAQNKHGAPGVCTHSGSALFRLYRYTKDVSYLELCRAIAHSLPQYVSRDDRPILDYDGNPAPSGDICERVSTCDWEGFDKIGGIFGSGCWCEASLLCTYTDIPGVYCDRDTGLLCCIDHVTGALRTEGSATILSLTNPTPYPAKVKVLIDSGDCRTLQDINYLSKMQTVSLNPGETADMTITL